MERRIRPDGTERRDRTGAEGREETEGEESEGREGERTMKIEGKFHRLHGDAPFFLPVAQISPRIVLVAPHTLSFLRNSFRAITRHVPPPFRKWSTVPLSTERGDFPFRWTVILFATAGSVSFARFSCPSSSAFLAPIKRRVLSTLFVVQERGRERRGEREREAK